MKKTNLFSLFFACLPLTCFLQIIPNANFANLETVPCPYDSTISIVQPVNWRLYQTLNNKWDGTIDSSICISLNNGPGAMLDLGTINPDKALFVSGLMDFTSSTTLTPDWIYGAIGNIQYPTDVSFNINTNCPNNLCSGLIVGVEIPDSSFTGTNTRFHFDIPNTPGWLGYFETCVPTEYFDSNVLTEFIFKLTLDTSSINLDGKLLTLQSAAFYDWYLPIDVPAFIEAPNFNSVDSSYSVNLQQTIGAGWGSNNFFFKYGDPTNYPSSDHLFYIEAAPQPNVAESREVNIVIDPNNTVVFQPYTALRGALVEGGDTLRHTANLVNNGGDFCLDQIIDFVFDDGSKLIHNGGHINFEGKSACLMFQNKAALVVGENQSLYYGQNGKGILALMPGGEIHLEKNSELIIDNTLWIFGLEDRKYPPVFNIYLEPGNKLVFGENAHLVNHFSTQPNTQLNVYMNGGILDDSQLNTPSRNLINRIYPKPAERFLDNITIYENPVGSELNFGFVAKEPGVMNLELFDMSGRLMATENYLLEKGHNKNTHLTNNIPAGIYALKLKIGQQTGTVKIFKI